MVINVAQFHSTKPELRFCAVANTALGKLVIVRTFKSKKVPL